MVNHVLDNDGPRDYPDRVLGGGGQALVLEDQASTSSKLYSGRRMHDLPLLNASRRPNNATRSWNASFMSTEAESEYNTSLGAENYRQMPRRPTSEPAERPHMQLWDVGFHMRCIELHPYMWCI